MSAGNSHRVRVQIGGMDYTLRGPEPEEQLRAVAELVDKVMHRIAAANPNLDGRRVAVLAALNIADDLRKTQKEYEALWDLMEQERAGTSGGA